VKLTEINEIIPTHFHTLEANTLMGFKASLAGGMNQGLLTMILNYIFN